GWTGRHPSAREAGLWDPPARRDGSRPGTEPPSAPPHRPVSAPAARRTDHAHPPTRADALRAPSHAGWTAHGGGRLAGALRADRRIPAPSRAGEPQAPSRASGRIAARHPATERAAPPAGECARRAE